MKVSTIVCTYNRHTSLRLTLMSLNQMCLPPDLEWELVVVDNNSSDETREVVEAFARAAAVDVRYVFEGNQGQSYARNTGLREAKGEIIAFTDDDVTVHPRWLAALKRTFDEFDGIGVAGRVVPVWDYPQPSWLDLSGPYALGGPIVNLNLGEEPRYITKPPVGANMAFRKQAFKKYRVFRTDLGLVGVRGLRAEDSEFGARLIMAGERIVYAPEAIIYHPVEQHRTTKAYFLSWYFLAGRASARTEPGPEEALRYFGVPRWLLRRFLEGLIKWIATVDRKRRFFHKIRVYSTMGAIYEAYSLARARTKSIGR